MSGWFLAPTPVIGVLVIVVGISLISQLLHTKRPAAGVPTRSARVLRDALLALDRPDGAFRVRDGAPEGVDLVAEATTSDARSATNFQTLLAFDDRRRVVRSIDEIHGSYRGRLSRSRSFQRGQLASIEFRADGTGFSFSSSAVKRQLRAAVLEAGWTWRGVAFVGHPRSRVPWNLLSILPSAALLVTALVSVLVAGVPTQWPTTTFAGGETLEVFLDPADDPAIYARVDRTGTVSCELLAGPGRGAITQPDNSHSVTVNDVTWRRVFLLDLPAPGTRTLTCETDGTMRFAVEADRLQALGEVALRSAPLAIAGVLLLPLPTVVRRLQLRAARRRRTGGEHYGPPTGAE